MLKLSNVDTFYGPIQALRNVSLRVEEGEIVSLLGGNACGKSTTMKTILGLVKARYKQLASTLSGGEQQMVAMARALMARPKLLIMDEPSMGLSPLFVDRIFSIIQQINQEQGVSILLVEQNANMALSIAGRGYVLQTGEIVLHDTAQNLLKNPLMQKAYLGVA